MDDAPQDTILTPLAGVPVLEPLSENRNILLCSDQTALISMVARAVKNLPLDLQLTASCGTVANEISQRTAMILLPEAPADETLAAIHDIRLIAVHDAIPILVFASSSDAESAWHERVAEYDLIDFVLPHQLGLALRKKIITCNLIRHLRESIHRAEQARSEITISRDNIEQYAHVAAHDMQEPVRTITSYLQMFIERYSDQVDERGRWYIRRVISSLEHVRELITSTLEFSLATMGPLMHESLDLRALIDEILLLMEPRLLLTRAEIQVGNMPVIVGNRSQLKRVVMNLLTNAIKFNASQQPQIVISCADDHDTWIVSIKDNGIGIDKDTIPTLFQPGKRLNSTEKYPGSGFGLAICRKIIEHHGGRIWIESSVGLGSTVSFSLKKSYV